ncbi:helix-turn-helix transcriptional regulator [Lentzea sp. NBRC 105346]|uniref:response regulator transcription factor n=1 Tax=Lentzea sp. NBRC 105346 TaxID=3032205 RepID=UPI0024A3D504|nr:response regulator transcription factor [Lentzea sp. NBRC 105346]GLZ30102.1 helix-turn-helix transcriptional regulator [Lentzea sp. NBRC 105346]
MRLIRVALVESLPLMKCGVQTVVSEHPLLEWAGAVSTTREAVELCESARPDVLLITSASDPGWHRCQLLTRLFRQLTVVVLLGADARTADHIAMARLHGVRALVPLEADPGRLVAAITAGVSAGHFVDPSLATGAASVSTRGTKSLSRREYEVLQLIAEGRTAVQIALRLQITAETARTHVRRILRKLEARDRAHAVARAYELSVLSR